MKHEGPCCTHTVGSRTWCCLCNLVELAEQREAERAERYAETIEADARTRLH